MLGGRPSAGGSPLLLSLLSSVLVESWTALGSEDYECPCTADAQPGNGSGQGLLTEHLPPWGWDVCVVCLIQAWVEGG